jgi:hypothetical protein
MIDSSNESLIESELEELVSLAEQSTNQIDDISTAIAVSEMRLIWPGLVCFVSLIISAFVIDNIQFLFGVQGDERLLIKLFLFLVMFSLVTSVGFLFKIRITEIKRMRRDLLLERDISGRLLSLIEEQIRRVRIENKLSPVTLATFEIRTRRLDRSKYN